MTTVMVATPHGGHVHPEYYRHLLQMQAAWPQHQFRHAEIDMMIIGKARNMLVDMALSLDDVEVVWFIDDDTLPPPHAGKLIDEALELGIVSGLYFARRPPYTPQAYRKAYEPHLRGMYWPLIEYPESGMMVVDAVGGGMLCVRKDVLVHMREHFTNRRDRYLERVRTALSGRSSERELEAFEWMTTYLHALSPWFEFLDRKGEDLYFCERAHDAGYVTYLDLDVKCAHLGVQPIEEQHFRFLVDNSLIGLVPSESPGGDAIAMRVGPAPDDQILPQPHGGAATTDEHEHPDGYFTRTKALERGDDLQGASGRVGKRKYLPRAIAGP